MNKLIWYIKQLFPLTYWGYYQKPSKQVNGMNNKLIGPYTQYKNYFTIWHMWFGKCYDITTVETNECKPLIDDAQLFAKTLSKLIKEEAERR